LTRILLIRHGQSTWNADGRWQGHADPPLSELGRRQAAAAGTAITDAGFTSIVASPLQRAHQTASIVGDVLGLAVANDERLMERDAGEWTGMTREEIEAGWPGYLAENRRPPAFETDDILVHRAMAALQDIAAIAHEPIVVFSHGGLIRVVERTLGDEPHAVPNLGGLDLRRATESDGDHALALTGRTLLIDADTVAVTSPPEI
jgi:broad specificity phosphatase PhoE